MESISNDFEVVAKSLSHISLCTLVFKIFNYFSLCSKKEMYNVLFLRDIISSIPIKPYACIIII